jgi:hypothetical protein
MTKYGKHGSAPSVYVQQWPYMDLEKNMGHVPDIYIDTLLNTPLKLKAEVEDLKH